MTELYQKRIAFLTECKKKALELYPDVESIEITITPKSVKVQTEPKNSMEIKNEENEIISVINKQDRRRSVDIFRRVDDGIDPNN